MRILLSAKFLVVEAVAFRKRRYMTVAHNAKRIEILEKHDAQIHFAVSNESEIRLDFEWKLYNKKQIGEKRKAYFVCKFDKLFARLYFRKREKSGIQSNENGIFFNFTLLGNASFFGK